MTGTSLSINKWLTSSIFALSACVVLAGVYVASSARADPGDVVYTPGPPPDPNDPVGFIPQELPIEVETELAPAGSLKQAPLWKELERLLDDPYGEDGPVGSQRRPSFLPAGCSYQLGAVIPCDDSLMPDLNVYGIDESVLTDEPLRYRVLNGEELSEEVSWDQPGALFDQDAVGPGFPAGLLPIIGYIVVDPATNNLVVCNGVNEDGEYPCDDPLDDDLLKLPADDTVVATPATIMTADGLRFLDPETMGVLEELETPINEIDFLREEDDTRGIGDLLLANGNYPVGRSASEVLGKSLFWDMQVGSDGVQACGSCHFAAGADPRTRNQLNPGSLGGDFLLEVRQPTEDVVATDFPFHKSGQDDLSDDSNDVMSSMGVIFRTFDDIPPIGDAGFGPAAGPAGDAALMVRPVLPDEGTADPDPIPVFQGFRRVEPRNTPMMITAAFNFDNFWDGRARFHFNGGSVFGASDPFFHVFVVGDGLGMDGTGDIGVASPLGCGAHPSEEHLDALEDAEAGGAEVHFRIVNVAPDGSGHCPSPAAAEDDPVPVRIKFSSLASQAVGPPLSNFEMSFDGRNWAKIGKKLLQQEPIPIVEGGAAMQNGAVPLANQLVDVTDSVMGPFSNQGGAFCNPATSVPGKPGLCISYSDLIRLAFKPELWINESQHMAPVPEQSGLGLTTNPFDPFDDLVLMVSAGPAVATDRDQFTQMEANFSLLFGLSVQTYEQLLIPDNTPFDQFMDANPLAANAVGQPGEQGVLPPLGEPGNPLSPGIRELVTGDPNGSVVMVEGFGPDEMFGFDIFAGANLTAALPPDNAVGSSGRVRLNDGFGSNPFLRSGRCMICHLGPEQTDHTINVNHGLLLSDTEFELPPPGQPEPTGPFKTVPGLILAEEVEETAQDGVEVENRNFALFDDPATDIDETQVAPGSAIAFQDNGIYNIGVRPTAEDIGRGGDDPFSLLGPGLPGDGQREPLAPLALAALAMKNLGGLNFEPCDSPDDLTCTGPMPNFDPAAPCPDPDPAVCNPLMFSRGGGLFEPSETDQRINPGLERAPTLPLLPPYLAPFTNNLPAGELHPQIDELAFAPNTVTPPPFSEFTEIQFGSDLHCAAFVGDPTDPVDVAANIWGPLCPNVQSAVSNNLVPWLNGTWGRGDPTDGTPVPGSEKDLPNRVARDGAIKAPQLRMVELTGPFFRSGSYLTLRQVIDFYFRGGDFPLTNAEDRDPNLVNIEEQAFGFGRTLGLDPATLDGVPDAVSQYGLYPYNGLDPDGNPIPTPEPVFPSRGAALEDAKESLVKFLLALTDDRVKQEQAPFDRPEIFVPLDGTAPDNTGGRNALLADAKFLRVPPVGAGGRPAAALPPLGPFLGVNHFAADSAEALEFGPAWLGGEKPGKGKKK